MQQAAFSQTKDNYNCIFCTTVSAIGVCKAVMVVVFWLSGWLAHFPYCGTASQINEVCKNLGGRQPRVMENKLQRVSLLSLQTAHVFLVELLIESFC